MKNDEIAYAEVDTILSLMDEKYVNRIPEKLRKIFKEDKNFDYTINIDVSKSLNEQNLQRETMVILAMLCVNYWCDSEEEKQELIKAYSENEKKNEAEIREKYNPDNIFKNTEQVHENKELVEYNESIIKRLWNKIKSFFVKR